MSCLYGKLQRRFRRRVAGFAFRARLWLRRTGLLPPELRGFVPRQDEPQERPGTPVWTDHVWPDRRLPACGNHRVRDDHGGDSPAWHNVIRAYEEDR